MISSTSPLKVSVIIPSLNPDHRLIALVNGLLEAGLPQIIVVNDGSSVDALPIFSELKNKTGVTVLEHAINLGKGAALKSGFNYHLCNFKEHLGVVTADADGQHQLNDILKVAATLVAQPSKLVLGARELPKSIPLRSYVGNTLTRKVFWMAVGQKIHDTQSGLRGVPNGFMPFLLKRRFTGYEFELDMLITAKGQGFTIVQVPIETIYIDDNKSSHFDPLRDSMRIYFVFLRFMGSSLATALLDFIVFTLSFSLGASIGASTAIARTIAGIMNFATNRSFVFRSNGKVLQSLVKYIGLVAAFGYLSYNLVILISRNTGLNVFFVKALAESLLFFLSFALQRDFVFKGRKNHSANKVTDWDAYYSKPYKSAKLTRKFTENNLIEIMKHHIRDEHAQVSIAELGGANSCFFQAVQDRIRPASYIVFDNNQLGLDALRARIGPRENVEMINIDLLKDDLPEAFFNQFDIVYSVGLIEHFDQEGTAKIIEAHTKLLKPGGLLIITFPTPTWLYRVTRKMAEIFGLWIFHDERPLKFDEVFKSLPQSFKLVSRKILWPLFLTQGVVALESAALPRHHETRFVLHD